VGGGGSHHLSSAPLIYFHRHRPLPGGDLEIHHDLFVGIALALLGNFFLAVASTLGSHETVPMRFPA
jgi:hydrogenase-4 component F